MDKISRCVYQRTVVQNVQVCPFLTFVSKWVPREQLFSVIWWAQIIWKLTEGSDNRCLTCSLYSIWVDPRRLGTHIFHHFPRQFQLRLSFLLLPKKPWFLPVASKLPRRHCVRSIYLSRVESQLDMPNGNCMPPTLAFLKGTNFHHNASVSLFVEYFRLLLATNHKNKATGTKCNTTAFFIHYSGF